MEEQKNINHINNLFKYIVDGITIEKLSKSGYRVFTIPTQHFEISSLEELTPESFEKAIKLQQELDELQNGLINLMSKKGFVKI